MQFASITYRRVAYTPYFEYVFSYNEDDPQESYSTGPYDIDEDESIPILIRPVTICFHYKRDNKLENAIPILTKEQALEILQKHVTSLIDDEIKKLETLQEHLYVLKYKAHNTELSN